MKDRFLHIDSNLSSVLCSYLLLMVLSEQLHGVQGHMIVEQTIISCRDPLW